MLVYQRVQWWCCRDIIGYIINIYIYVSVYNHIYIYRCNVERFYVILDGFKGKGVREIGILRTVRKYWILSIEHWTKQGRNTSSKEHLLWFNSWNIELWSSLAVVWVRVRIDSSVEQKLKISSAKWVGSCWIGSGWIPSRAETAGLHAPSVDVPEQKLAVHHRLLHGQIYGHLRK